MLKRLLMRERLSMAKENIVEISKGTIIGLILGVGLGLIFDQVLIGVAAGLLLGGGAGFIMSRRLEDY